jgi:hypothetical protein
MPASNRLEPMQLQELPTQFTNKRALYISPVNVAANNGMLQRQRQNLAVLESLYPQGLDVLSLGSSRQAMHAWLRSVGASANVLGGPFAAIARLSATAWYGGGIVLCNKLGWFDHFRFPIRMSLPSQWAQRYDRIVCYYPWAHRLLRLEELGTKVVVDLGDVMADRHLRTGARRWISLDACDERAVLESGSHCYAISSDDASEFARLYHRDLQVLPFVPMDVAPLMSILQVGRPRSVGFIGAPSFLNEEILLLLANPAFLDILSAANVALVVAGGICATARPEIIQALRDGGAEVRGRVHEINDFYRDIGVVINPVGPSTGVKIKSVEALLAGRALITTQWGVDKELTRTFSSQIQPVNWPVDPSELARCAVTALAAAADCDRQATQAYVTGATRAMHAAFAPPTSLQGHRQT